MRLAIREAVLVLLLAAASGGAMADWVRVGSSDTDTLYADPDTIRWSDDTAKMWAMNDFKTAQRKDARDPFKSEKAEYEYDCKGRLARLLYFTSHADNMAQGEIVDFNVVPGEWMPFAPNSGLEELWKIACGDA
jgi:hypothetical protein